MRIKVGVLRTNRSWFLSRAFWRITKWIIWMLIPIMNIFFFRDPIFLGKLTSLSNKPSIQKTPYPWMNLSYIFFEMCIRFSYFSHITARVWYIVSWSHGAHLGYLWWYHSSIIPWLPSHHHPTPRTGDSPWQLASRWGSLKTMGLHPVGGRNPRSLPMFTRFRYGRKLWAT